MKSHYNVFLLEMCHFPISMRIYRVGQWFVIVILFFLYFTNLCMSLYIPGFCMLLTFERRRPFEFLLGHYVLNVFRNKVADKVAPDTWICLHWSLVYSVV